MKTYLSGRIKDTPDFEDHFIRAKLMVVSRGGTPISPLELDFPSEATYEDFMRVDLRALLDCEAIFMIAGWEKSAGARCEHHVACMIGLRVIYE